MTRPEIDGPFCAFKDYRRRARKRPGQWTWKARARRTERIWRAWCGALNRQSIRDHNAAVRGPRAPKRHPLDPPKEPRP